MTAIFIRTSFQPILTINQPRINPPQPPQHIPHSHTLARPMGQVQGQPLGATSVCAHARAGHSTTPLRVSIISSGPLSLHSAAAAAHGDSVYRKPQRQQDWPPVYNTSQSRARIRESRYQVRPARCRPRRVFLYRSVRVKRTPRHTVVWRKEVRGEEVERLVIVYFFVFIGVFFFFFCLAVVQDI